MSAFTIDNYYFWVPALMPIVGAVLGAIVYHLLIGLHAAPVGGHSTEEEEESDDEDSETKKYDMES